MYIHKHKVKIRRNIVMNLKGKKADMKAVALLVFLKKRTGKYSCVSKSSLSRIARVASVSASTVKKYMSTWVKMGLVEWQGKNHDVFVIRRMAAKVDHRNYDISEFDFSSFKSTYYSLRSMIFLTIQAQKEYIKRMIRTAADPKRWDNFKAVKKFCSRYAHMDRSGKYVFKENGISYKRIGKVVGFCERTAERIVKFAVERNWVKKETHFNYTYMPGVCFREVHGYTFTTWNYGYVVGANTYTLSDSMIGSLLDGKK